MRNPLIAETLYKSKDIERWGSGIKRIHDECLAAGVRVDFTRLKTGFVVIFYRKPAESLPHGAMGKTVEKSVEKTVEIILELMKANPQITQKQIMGKTDLSRRGVEWNLKRLKQERRIKRIGPDKGGHWEILK